MERRDISRVMNFLYQYKKAMLEKVLDKMDQFVTDDDPNQYTMGNFAVEDFMDNHAMRLSHLNVLYCEMHNQMEEQTPRYERLETEVHEIAKEDLKTRVKYYTELVPPADLKWINLEKVSDDEYLLFIVRRVDA